MVLSNLADDSVVKTEVAGSSQKCLLVLTFSTHFSQNLVTLAGVLEVLGKFSLWVGRSILVSDKFSKRW